MDKRILFLDLSTLTTGYAIFNNGEYQTSGVLKAVDEDSSKRALHILDAIEALIITYQPNKIVAEKLPPMSHRGQEVCIYLHGGLKFLALRQSIDLIDASTPTHWRKVLGFNQSKTNNKTQKIKEQSLAYAKNAIGKEVLDHNEADAICLGYAYYKEEALKKEELSKAEEVKNAGAQFI